MTALKLELGPSILKYYVLSRLPSAVSFYLTWCSLCVPFFFLSVTSTVIDGYGFCHIPTSPGFHELTCSTWRPTGTISQQIAAYFVGGGPQLKSEDLIHSSTDRYRLRTTAMGNVHLQLHVITRNFQNFGVET